MTASTVIKTAAAQIACSLFDIPANVEKHIEMIHQARAAGVELLLFPELSLTGYQVGPRCVDMAISVDDPLLTRLAEAAGDMTVVLGFVEEAYAAQFFNSAVALRGGRMVFLHRKLNPATYGNLEEGKYFATGRYVETFPVKRPFTASILICADLWNPALVYLAALHGTTMMLVPINSAYESVGGGFYNPSGWDAALHFYAMIYGMPLVMANRVGREDGLTFWGGSRILDAHGNLLAEAGAGEETLIIADIDYQDVRKARFELPTVRDSNLALIHREIDRLASSVGVPSAIRQP